MMFFHSFMFFPAIKVDHQIHDLLFFFPFVLHLLTLFYAVAPLTPSVATHVY